MVLGEVPENKKWKFYDKKLCEVCMEKSAIYRCPRCSKRTCSLPCVRQHKEDSKCSGQGQHTNTPAFVSKECFSEAMMHDDLAFLERTSTQLKKTRKLKPKKMFNSKRFKILSTFARRQHIKLLLLPAGMARHKSNTSLYNLAQKKIFWRVDLNFTELDINIVMNKCPDCVPLAEALSVAVVLHVERHACSESRLSDSPPSSLSQTDVCMHDSNVNTVADIGEGDVGVGPFSEPLCGSKSTDRDVDQCTGCGGEGCEVVPVETEKGDAVRGIFDKISNVVKQQGLGEADDECWRLSGHQKRRHDMNSPSVESSIGHVNKPSGQSTVAGWNADEEYDGESVGVKLESLRSNVRLVIDFPDKHQGAFITDVAQVHLSRCDVCRHLMQIVSCKGWKDCSVFMTVPGLPTGQQRYYRLSVESTLRCQLANRWLLEFPSLVVVFDMKCLNTYRIISPEEDSMLDRFWTSMQPKCFSSWSVTSKAFSPSSLSETEVSSRSHPPNCLPQKALSPTDKLVSSTETVSATDVRCVSLRGSDLLAGSLPEAGRMTSQLTSDGTFQYGCLSGYQGWELQANPGNVSMVATCSGVDGFSQSIKHFHDSVDFVNHYFENEANNVDTDVANSNHSGVSLNCDPTPPHQVFHSITCIGFLNTPNVRHAAQTILAGKQHEFCTTSTIQSSGTMINHCIYPPSPRPCGILGREQSCAAPSTVRPGYSMRQPLHLQPKNISSFRQPWSSPQQSKVIAPAPNHQHRSIAWSSPQQDMVINPALNHQNHSIAWSSPQQSMVNNPTLNHQHRSIAWSSPQQSKVIAPAPNHQHHSIAWSSPQQDMVTNPALNRQHHSIAWSSPQQSMIINPAPNHQHHSIAWSSPQQSMVINPALNRQHHSIAWSSPQQSMVITPALNHQHPRITLTSPQQYMVRHRSAKRWPQ